MSHTDRVTRPGALAATFGSMALIFAASVGAVAFTPHGSGAVAAWWPAAGIAAALLCLIPRGWLLGATLGVAVVTALANHVAGRPIGVSAAFGAANAAEAVVLAIIVRWRRDAPARLCTSRDLLRCVIGSTVGALVIGSGVALTVAGFGLGDPLDSAVGAAASHVAATMCIVPLALAWADRHPRPPRSLRSPRPLPSPAVVVQTILLGGAVAASLLDGPLRLTFLAVPLLVWVAYSAGLRVLTLQLTILTALATAATAAGEGPFPLIASVLPELAPVALVQLFAISIVLMTLPLAIAVGEQRRLTGRLGRSEELFRSAFDDSGVGKAVVEPGDDDRLRVRRVNTAGMALLGEDDIVGRPWDELMTLVEPNGSMRDLGADRPGRATASPRRRPELVLQLTWSPLHPSGDAPDSGLDGALTLEFVDVTAQHEARQQVERALAAEREAVGRLQQLDRAQREFISTASHELRTPVTTIVGFADILADGSLGEPAPEQVKVLAALRRSGDRLQELTNHLLVLSRLDSGETAHEELPLNLSGVVREATDALRVRAIGASLRLECALPVEPVRILGDAALLDRLVTNLLSNAIKFSRPDGVVIIRLGTEPGVVVLEVIDQGIGIPESEQDRVFSRFFRSSTAQAGAIQGTGLGLSIVDAIAHRHRGSVAFRSEVGVGTTFSVRLPLPSSP